MESAAVLASGEWGGVRGGTAILTPSVNLGLKWW